MPSKTEGPPPLQSIHVLSVHSVTGCDFFPIGLTQCNVTLGHTQFIYTFNVCKHIEKEPVIEMDMQHLHHLGCDWTEIGCIFLDKVPRA